MQTNGLKQHITPAEWYPAMAQWPLPHLTSHQNAVLEDLELGAAWNGAHMSHTQKQPEMLDMQAPGDVGEHEAAHV